MALPDWAVNNFTVEAAVQGPQIIINWSYDGDFDPTKVSQLKLLKRQREFPIDETDGTVVYSEINPGAPDYFTTTYYDDLNVINGEFYYYSMFAYVTATSTWEKHDLTSGMMLAFNTGIVADRAWRDLAQYEKVKDLETTQAQLLEVVVPDRDSVHPELENLVRPGQKLHYGSHEMVQSMGFLQRFLRLLAIEMDRVYGISKHTSKFFDVNTAPLDMLSILGKRIGVTVDVEAAPERRREEIKRAIPLYRIKGTKEGMRVALNVLIPWTLEFDEVGNNIMVFNREDRVFWNEPDFWKMGTPGDTTSYFPGTGRYERNFDKVIFYFTAPVPLTEPLTPTQIQKSLERIIPKNLQASHSAIPVFIYSPAPETARLSITETNFHRTKMMTAETARLTITESVLPYNVSDKFLYTASSGVATRDVSDPSWVTPKRRT